MDGQSFHDLGGYGVSGSMRRDGDDQRRYDGIDDDDVVSKFVPDTHETAASDAVVEHGTPMRRRIITESSPEDLAEHDSFDDESNRQILHSETFDEDSDDNDGSRRIRPGGGVGDSGGRDMRKAMEATTPTLIDEEDFGDDEEQEIVSLEHERLRQRAFFGRDDHLRRTPGAQMYTSSFNQQNMRRTPGASQMHASANTNVVQHNREQRDSSALGFGLTLSTPVAGPTREKSLDLSSQAPQQHSALGSSTKVTIAASKGARPPTVPGTYNREQQQRTGAFVTPWSLSENSHLDNMRASYSPNTLRLTEDLGNLLLEDDEGTDEPIFTGSQFVADRKPEAIGLGSKEEVAESWTAPFVIGADPPSGRTSRSSGGRGRRGKADSYRRSSRGYDRSHSRQTPPQHYEVPGTGGFLSNAQHPTPLRGGQGFGALSGRNFGFDGSGQQQSNDARYFVESQGSATGPRQLNFGGAFAPPSKMHGGIVPRSVPSPSTTGPTPGHFDAADTGIQSTFPPNGSPAFGAAFQNPFQQIQQPFGAHAPQKFQPHGGAPPPLFGGNPDMRQSPTFDFPPPQNVGYPMHVPGMHPPPQDFMPTMAMHHPHHSHPHHQQPPPVAMPHQVWPQPQPMPMQFGSGLSMDQATWPGSHHNMWPMGEYGYGVQRASESGVPDIPVQDFKGETMSGPQVVGTNPFSNFSHAAMSQEPRAPQTARTSASRGKNQRKNATRRGAKQKNQGGQRIDSSKPRIDSSNQTSTTSKKSSAAASKAKKKPSAKDRSTPPAQSFNVQTTANEERTETPADMSADAKRAELVESPAVRSAFKDFYRKFRAEEKISPKDAEKFALQEIEKGSLPESINWKVYLELADLAKRNNRFTEARNLYQQVCHLQPFASQGWLEYSKLEEECGNMIVCAKILKAGLGYCVYSENLLTRAIKHEEKIGNLGRARELLSRLKHVGIDKVWRTVLEGALLEARAGNDVMARRVLKYLMHHVPWYGPLYLEAYKLEKDLGRSKEALAIVERGLSAIPRYGPLWFGAFRLCEELDMMQTAYELPQSMSMIQRASNSISKELIWKVHLEAAQMLERSSVESLSCENTSLADGIMNLSRKHFAITILTCPPNLRWKVWLASGRMEIAAGNPDRARNLFFRAHRVVPDKGRAVALLECARLEEFVGDTDLASAILCKSRRVSGSDWKVWLESVLLEIRYSNYGRATELALGALKQHSGTGRLWASLVQLRHFDQGEEAQFEALKFALNAVPKSGEVWCEGARIHLNPFSRTFDLSHARRHLYFATKFTPQYGDGFLESLRLEVLEQWLLPLAKTIWERTKHHLELSEKTSHEDELVEYMSVVVKAIHSFTQDASPSESLTIFDDTTRDLVVDGLESRKLDETVKLVHLKLRCANADPNYGSMWFYCRTGPTDTARKILSRAIDLMITELQTHAKVYLAALVRRFAVLACFHYDRKSTNDKNDGDEKAVAEGSAEFENLVKSAYLSSPSLKDIIHNTKANSNEAAHVELLESAMSESSFITGLVALSKLQPMDKMSFHERRRALFGTDSLFS